MSLATRVIESLAEQRKLSGHDRRAMDTHPAIIDNHRRVPATCSDCTRTFAMAPRTKREREQLGRPLLCDICKRPARIRVTQAHRNFWKQRFTESEYVELAEAIWGPRSEWT